MRVEKARQLTKEAAEEKYLANSVQRKIMAAATLGLDELDVEVDDNEYQICKILLNYLISLGFYVECFETASNKQYPRFKFHIDWKERK